MTLLDYPGKVACTVFLQGCNFRCPFCHNSEMLPPSDETSDSSINKFFSFLITRRDRLDAVCVSGGEPTIHSSLPGFLRAIKQMGFLVKLDTNGSNPAMLRKLVEGGYVDCVAMDIKNSPAEYANTTGVDGIAMSNIEESIRILLNSDIEHEFRTTVVAELHNAQSVAEMGEWLFRLNGNSKIKRHFIQPFTDRDTVLFTGLHTPEAQNISTYKTILENYAEYVEVRG